MKVFDKFIDILGKPINFNFILASFCTSLLLLLTNFLPNMYLKRLHLEVFLDTYSYIVVIIFLISFFLLIIHVSSDIRKKRNISVYNKYIAERQNDMFKDQRAMEILNELYKNNPQATYLPIYNQKVQLLEQYELIMKVAQQVMSSDINNPKFPYILQPVAEERLKKNWSNKSNFVKF